MSDDYNSQFNQSWQAGNTGMPPPANGNIDAWQQGNATRQWNQAELDRQNSSAFGGTSDSSSGATATGGAWGSGGVAGSLSGSGFSGGGYSGGTAASEHAAERAGTGSSGGGASSSGPFAVPVLIIVLLVAAAPVSIAAAAAALFAAVPLAALTRLLGGGDGLRYGRAYRAAFFAMVAAGVVAYLCSHLAALLGLVLRAAPWHRGVPGATPLMVAGAVVLMVGPALLAHAAVVMKILGPPYTGWAGYAKACAASALSLLTVLAAGIGLALLLRA